MDELEIFGLLLVGCIGITTILIIWEIFVAIFGPIIFGICSLISNLWAYADKERKCKK